MGTFMIRGKKRGQVSMALTRGKLNGRKLHYIPSANG